MSDSNIRQSVLALAAGGDDALIEKNFAATEALLEDAANRRELTSSICIEAATACRSREAGERILSIVLHSFILEPTKESAYAICNLFITFGNGLSVRSISQISKEELVEDASSILLEELPSDKRKTHIDALLEVARTPMTDENRGIYIPALILANHLYESAVKNSEDFYETFTNALKEDEGSWRNDIVDLLGRRIFALGSKCRSATKDEVDMLSPLIQGLTSKEFEHGMIRPLRFKLGADLEGTLDTMTAFVPVLNANEKTEFIISHLKPPTNLVASAIRQIKKSEIPYNTTGTKFLVEVMKTTSSTETESIIKSLSEALNCSFEDGTTSDRIAIYVAFQEIAKYFQAQDHEGDKNKKEFAKKTTDSVISTLTSAMEKEEENEDMDEDCISASNNASDSWTSVLEKISPSQAIKAPLPSTPTKATGNGGISMEENDRLIKSRAKNMTNSAPTATLPGRSTEEADNLIKSRARLQVSQAPSTPGVVFENSKISSRINGKLSYNNVNTPGPSVVPNSEDRGAAKSSLDLFQRPQAPKPRENNSNTFKSNENIPMPKTKDCDKEPLLPIYDEKSNTESDKNNSSDLVFDINDNNLANYSAYGAENEASHGLVTAMAVEEDEYDMPISYAQTYEEKIPFHKNRRVITYTIGFIVILVITVTGASLFTTKKVIDSSIESESPSQAPTAPPTSVRDSSGIWERLAQLSGPDILLGKAGDVKMQQTPQFKAANWLINEDARQLDVSDDLLEQRYILALIYFSTNGDDWTQCSFDPNVEECVYFDSTYQSEFTEMSFLSSEHECTWFQTYCSSDNVVRELTLYQNNLTGTIVTEIAALRKLRRLRLNANNMSGTLPSELGSMKHLADLEVQANKLQGTLPEEIFDIDTLQSLNVAINNFEGPVPDKFDNLKNIKGIHMFENSFEGTIPESIGRMPFLSFVLMFKNKFTGTIPTNLLNKSRMKQILLYENRLTGTLPSDVGQMRSLERLMLNDNKLEGTLPEELYDLENLQWLYLQSNKFTGSILPKIDKMKSLKRGLFRWNDFSGTVPAEIGNLTELEYLWFHYNSFEGSMPDQICELKDRKLVSLMADCLEDYRNATFKCDCCTDCCDKDQETCFLVK